jgi:hypothetical protein
MLRKYASIAVLDAWTAGDAKLRRHAHRHTFDYTPRLGYLYVRSRAISSRINDNFDHFPADEIRKAYATFIGKPVFVNHHNDDHRKARGVIIDAALHEDVTPQGLPDTWVEVLMEIDAMRFPKLAKAILAGEIDRTSMGVDVSRSRCSACGNEATTPLEYCAHIPGKKGQKLRRTGADGTMQDTLIYETCMGLHFFENSVLVEDPADPTAFFLGVDDRGVGGGYVGDVPVTASRTAARILFYRNDAIAMTLCPRHTSEQDKAEGFEPVRADDPTLAGEIAVCAECGKTLRNSTGDRLAVKGVPKDDYKRGFAAGQRGAYSSMERADDRRESSAWYLGFFDGEGGHPMWTSMSQDGVLNEDHLNGTASRRTASRKTAAMNFTLVGGGSGTHQFELHIAGCSDLGAPKYQTADRNQIEAENWSDAVDQWIDDQMRSQGYSASDVRVYPCAKTGSPVVKEVKAGKCPGSGQPFNERGNIGRVPCPVCGKYVAGGNVRSGRVNYTVPSHTPLNATASMYEYDSVPAGQLKAGDRIIQPNTDEELEIASVSRKPIKQDPHRQWVQLVFIDGREVEVHEGDYIDKLGSRTAAAAIAVGDEVFVDFSWRSAEQGWSQGRWSLATVLSLRDDGYMVRSARSEYGETFIPHGYIKTFDEATRVEGSIHTNCPDCGQPNTTRSGICDACIQRRFEQRELDEAADAEWIDRLSARTASRRTAYGETVAPTQVNTLREQSCPVCSEESGYNGETCNVCGFIKPPDEFMDPDLSKAQRTDLRQQVDELADEQSGGDDGELELEGAEQEDGATPTDGDMFRLEKPGTEDEEIDDELAPDDQSATSPTQEPEVDADEADEADESQGSPGGVESDVVGDGTQDDDDTDDDEDDDDKSPFKLKKKQSTMIARRNRAGKKAEMAQKLTALAQLVRDQMRTRTALRRQAVQLNAQQKQIDAIAKLAGVESVLVPIKREASRRIADIDNPGNPIEEPAPEAPSETTDEALGDISTDTPGGGGESVETPGTVDESDVTPTATDDVTSPGAAAQVPEGGLDMSDDDVTRPVAGANEPIPVSDRRTEGDVTSIDEVRTDTANPIEDSSFTQTVGSAQQRVFASMRLARLQIEAGVVQGDDLSIGQVIAGSSRTDASINEEIATLERVKTARRAQPGAQPRQGQRAVPSIATAAAASGGSAPVITTEASRHIAEATDAIDLFD